MEELIRFSVTCDDFELMDKFKNEVNKIGIPYDSEFIEFNFYYFDDFPYLCFSQDWNGEGIAKCVLSLPARGEKIYRLQNEYKSALTACKLLFLTNENYESN